MVDDGTQAIRKLGNHLGKQVVFGYDRYLTPELDDYIRVLGQYGIAVPAVSQDDLHYLTSAQRVCERVRARTDRVGVLVCATGMGMSIAANKFRGIYAARCVTSEDARLARIINNVNVVCLAAGTGVRENERIVDAFMRTPFEGRKLEKLQTITRMELESGPTSAVLSRVARTS
jgi:RpiB/LacA/LacB family sugar-phosphate isomerase